jgi:hypothetical protein
MASVVTTLEPHNDVGLLGQPVDDLALAFVTPLGSDYDHVCHTTAFLSGPHDNRQPEPPAISK